MKYKCNREWADRNGVCVPLTTGGYYSPDGSSSCSSGDSYYDDSPVPTRWDNTTTSSALYGTYFSCYSPF